MNRIFITLLTLSLGLPALGQNSAPGAVQNDAQGRARLVARGDLVEITGGVSERQSVSEPLKEGDSLRTEIGSSFIPPKTSRLLSELKLPN